LPQVLGELIQIVPFEMVDAVLAKRGAVRRRLRKLPARVVVYLLLAAALFGECGYPAVWSRLTAALTTGSLPLAGKDGERQTTYYELPCTTWTQHATEGVPMKVPGLFYNAKTFKDVPAGTVIFEEGASGTEMFGIVEGEVEVRLRNGAVRRLGPDDTFGEMAIVDSSPRSGTVVAVTDTKLAVIDRSRFLFLVQETPMFALQVMSSIAERLRAETR
jgi:CRP/FNR family transcriptional regulator, cyclic AMP receptor protein